MNVDFQEQDITIEFTPEGQDGQSLKPKGAWSDTEKYKTLDLVTYQGDSYIALKAVPVGTLPTDTEYWMINASNQTTYWGTIAGTLTDQVDLKNALDAKADADEVYTKTETDDLLSLKADADDVYTKTAVDDALDLKADKADVYTQQELDGIFDGIDNALDTKADKSDTYTKTQTDTLLSAKADASAVYSKGETDSLLNAKANAADVYAKSQTYSKTETDDLLSTKANTADLGTLAGMNSIDYTSNYLTNKPTLGSLADQDTVDYATEVTNKPTLGDLAALNSIDYTSNYLTNKPTLGSLADQDSVDYETEVTNKPTLGTMSAESASDYYDKTEVNDLINNSGVVTELDASGSIATFETNLAENLSRLSVSIDPVQDLHGYDAPWPAGGGKNLANLVDANISSQQYCSETYPQSGSLIATTTANYGRVGYSFPVTSGETYTIKFKGVRSSNSYGMAFICNDATWSVSDPNYIKNFQIATTETYYTNTVTASNNVLFVGFYVSANSSGDTMTISEFQLEKGSTATSFAPYSNICPISGHTSATVSRTGKNLIDKTATDTTKGYKVNYYLNSSGEEFSFNGLAISEYLSAKPSITYTLSGIGGASPSICFYDINKTFISGTAYGSNSKITVISPVNCAFIRLTVVLSSIDSMQLELGSTATTYESPHVQTVTIDLDGTRYGGTVDVTTGTLTVTKAYWTKNTSTMNNNESYPGWSSSGIKDIVGSGKNGAIVGIQSNIAPISGTHGEGKNYYSVNTTATNDIIYLPTGTWNGKTQSQWIAEGIDVQLVIPLATPIVITGLTPAQIQALQGLNNVWADTGDVSLSYFNNSTAEAITDVKQMIANTETSMTATRNYTSGSLIIVGSALLKATSNISSGASLVIGTNCVRTTLEEWILSLIA